ncbi:MAG: hypothetical protein M1833_006066 [Piccolia ochrophora]|nr:MAG: hypothetical protein M1833_006066 [Piccolia ochrophora]
MPHAFPHPHLNRFPRHYVPQHHLDRRQQQQFIQGYWQDAYNALEARLHQNQQELAAEKRSLYSAKSKINELDHEVQRAQDREKIANQRFRDRANQVDELRKDLKEKEAERYSLETLMREEKTKRKEPVMAGALTRGGERGKQSVETLRECVKRRERDLKIAKDKICDLTFENDKLKENAKVFGGNSTARSEMPFRLTSKGTRASAGRQL